MEAGNGAERDEDQLDLGLDKITQDLAPFLAENPEAKIWR
jgi:hypothetical protein